MVCHCARRILPLLFLPLCMLAPGPVAGEDLRLNRSGSISVSMDPVLYKSNLSDSSYSVAIDQLFRTATATFAESLAEGLEKTVFRGQLKVLPGYKPEQQADFRKRGEPDSFLITVDLRSSYGLSEGSSFAALLAPASFFLLSALDMLTFSSHTEAIVDAFYVTPDGEQLHLVQNRFESAGAASGDFFDAMSMSQEFEWIALLTDRALDDLKGKILAEFPPRLVESSLADAAEADAPPERKPTESGALDPEELVRRIGPAVFKISTSQSTGSGFVISRRGFGVTTLHVVENAREISLRFHDGTELPARVVASEPELDLAVLVFESKGLHPLPFGDSGRVTLGDRLVAVGYPQEAGLTVIPGTVRSLEPFRGTPLLHVQASLPHGNSGAPMLNDLGEAVGIAFRRAVGEPEEIAFGIPINAARQAFQPFIDPP